MRRPIKCLALGAAVLSFFSPFVYVFLVEPAVRGMTAASPLLFEARTGGIGNSYGVFAVYPLYLLIATGFWYAWRKTRKYATGGVTLPYMSGVQAVQGGKAGFIGPMKGFVEAKSGNYYLALFFGEDRIVRTVNTVAIVLLAMLFGGVLR